MARVVDLTGENVTRKNRKERNYGTKTDLSSTTVERGNTHWAEGSNVHIDGLLGVAGTATVSGTLRVTGLLDVTGTLNASGQINLSGSTGITGPLNVTGTTTIGGNTSITGELNVTGPTTLDGVLDIGGDTTITGLLAVDGPTTISGKLDVTGAMATKGTLSVEGVTTLKNDLNITTGGKITAGNLMIEPANGGQINFLNGSLSSGSFGALLNNTVAAELLAPRINLNAPRTDVKGQLWVTEGANFASSVFTVQNLPTSANQPNIWVSSTGRFYRSTWTPA